MTRTMLPVNVDGRVAPEDPLTDAPTRRSGAEARRCNLRAWRRGTHWGTVF
jgi:hypothetical protein